MGIAFESSFNEFLSLLKTTLVCLTFEITFFSDFVTLLDDIVFEDLELTLIFFVAFNAFGSFFVFESFDYFKSDLLLIFVFSYFFNGLDFFAIVLVF